MTFATTKSLKKLAVSITALQKQLPFADVADVFFWKKKVGKVKFVGKGKRSEKVGRKFFVKKV